MRSRTFIRVLNLPICTDDIDKPQAPFQSWSVSLKATDGTQQLALMRNLTAAGKAAGNGRLVLQVALKMQLLVVVADTIRLGQLPDANKLPYDPHGKAPLRGPKGLR